MRLIGETANDERHYQYHAAPARTGCCAYGAYPSTRLHTCNTCGKSWAFCGGQGRTGWYEIILAPKP